MGGQVHPLRGSRSGVLRVCTRSAMFLLTTLIISLCNRANQGFVQPSNLARVDTHANVGWFFLLIPQKRFPFLLPAFLTLSACAVRLSD